VFTGDNAIYVVYAAAALCGIMLAETVFLLFTRNSDKRDSINRRMRLKAKEVSQRDVLVQLRKERGVDASRFSLFSMRSMQQLRVQSGLTMAMPKFIGATTAAGLLVAALIAYFSNHVFYGLAAAPVTVLLAPFVTLRRMRKKRHKIFGTQLAEALDLITRGLKAGHPVPVALAMVGREMPDPVGSEFGLVADEITFGSDLVTALSAMYDRVGQEDLPLFITAVSIQNSTGGNLREILDGLSMVIRERGKLRRKIRAISAEGRMSAMILTIVPIALMTILTVFMPDFYSAVTDKKMTWYLLGLAGFWLGLGNFIMIRMANFRF
jgi:tight adherence protein B